MKLWGQEEVSAQNPEVLQGASGGASGGQTRRKPARVTYNCAADDIWIKLYICYWLVVWNILEHVLCSHILGIIIPID